MGECGSLSMTESSQLDKEWMAIVSLDIFFSDQGFQIMDSYCCCLGAYLCLGHRCR